MAAGRPDIMALLAPEGGWNVPRPKDFQEPLLHGSGRTLPIQTNDCVVGNQVHLGPQATRMCGKRKRLVVGVIYAPNQDVFEGQVLVLSGGIVLASVQKLASADTFD